MWGNLKEIIQVLYNLSGIALVATVIIGIKQLKLLKTDLQVRNKRAAVEKSLEYLSFFSDDFLPYCAQYQNDLKEELPNPKSYNHLFDGNFYIEDRHIDKEMIAELIVKESKGIMNLINKLEFFSTAMLNGVSDEKIVFTPVAKVFCEFIEREHVYISVQRSSNGVPFENLIRLYKDWKKNIESEKAKIEKLEAEKKMNTIGEQKFKKPIGL
ncbi:DUF4760 domain-containing protein [Gottfriedia acidiceleris]|uniref:DUF4760 domain-containing protein n=1 Tax=Gottfriedia acidiceleris TaxID=371036 RepID=UPI00101D0965|nr:hypothetical protein [Gottfriedia acidiceleris]